MTLNQIIIGLLIFLLMVIRPFLYKPCIEFFPSKLSVTLTSVWLLVGLIISWPFFGYLLTENITTVCSSPYIILSISKGILMVFMIKVQQIINKKSTSSSVFFGFIAMALGSLVNNLFFNEGLKTFQLLCICALGALGLFFILKGDAKRLSLRGKINFISIVILGATFNVFDHITISKVGWYPHLFFSSLSMFFVCLYYGISKQDYINIFRNKNIALAGIIYTISEFLIIYSSINLLPVSFIAVFMRMAAPVVMLLSSILYHEQSIKNQLIFGMLAMIFIIPLIFA